MLGHMRMAFFDISTIMIASASDIGQHAKFKQQLSSDCRAFGGRYIYLNNLKTHIPEMPNSRLPACTLYLPHVA